MDGTWIDFVIFTFVPRKRNHLIPENGIQRNKFGAKSQFTFSRQEIILSTKYIKYNVLNTYCFSGSCIVYYVLFSWANLWNILIQNFIGKYFDETYTGWLDKTNIPLVTQKPITQTNLCWYFLLQHKVYLVISHLPFRLQRLLHLVGN